MTRSLPERGCHLVNPDADSGRSEAIGPVHLAEVLHHRPKGDVKRVGMGYIKDTPALIAYCRSILSGCAIFKLAEQKINQISARKVEIYFAIADITRVHPTLLWFIVEDW